MTIRWTDEEFLALDDKRHKLRTSWQAVGEKLFSQWLNSGAQSGTEGAKEFAPERTETKAAAPGMFPDDVADVIQRMIRRSGADTVSRFLQASEELSKNEPPPILDKDGMPTPLPYPNLKPAMDRESDRKPEPRKKPDSIPGRRRTVRPDR